MLAEKIKELRKKEGLTQEELASRLNVSRQAITKWETGEGLPDIDNLKNIALFFHVSRRMARRYVLCWQGRF